MIEWRKASLSFANGNCVEVAAVPGAVLIRDSKRPEGGHLTVSRNEWLRFTESVKGDGGK